MLFTDDNLELDRKYFPDLKNAISDPTIIHYTSALKSRWKDCSHPFKQEWWKYLKLTEWKGYKATYRYRNQLIIKQLRNFHLNFNW